MRNEIDIPKYFFDEVENYGDIAQRVAIWMKNRCIAILKDRADTAFDNMEGCDHDEFIQWEAAYCSSMEALEAVKKL